MPDLSTPAAELQHKIEQRTAVIAVVGLGYVGLPLLRAFFQAGFPVLGFDVDDEKVQMLRRGESYLKHLGQDFVRDMSGSDRFAATRDPQELSRADAIILCVPTPLGAHGEPDMSYARRLPADPRPERAASLGTRLLPRVQPRTRGSGSCKDYDTHTIPKLVGGIDAGQRPSWASR